MLPPTAFMSVPAFFVQSTKTALCANFVLGVPYAVRPSPLPVALRPFTHGLRVMLEWGSFLDYFLCSRVLDTSLQEVQVPPFAALVNRSASQFLSAAF